MAQYVQEGSLDYKQVPDPYFFKRVTLYFSSLSKKAEVDLSFLKKFEALKFLHINDVKFPHYMDSFPELEGVVELGVDS